MKKKTKRRPLGRLIEENSRSVVITYVILRALAVIALAISILRADYESAFTCAVVLVLYLLPDILERKLKIVLPSTLEIIILCFIYAALIMGEHQSFFVHYPHWDTLLHSTSGFLLAAVGYSLVDLLNDRENVSFKLSPLFMSLVAFCFAMTIGVLWEFVEFGADRLLGMDMQKDTVIHYFSSVTLDPTMSNIPIHVKDITDVAVNGESLGLGGYLDIGLLDTMEDFFVDFAGALVFSVVCYIDTKRHGRGKLVKNLVPHRKRSGQEKPGLDEKQGKA